MASVIRFLRLSLSPVKGIPDAWDVREVVVVALAALGLSGVTGVITNVLTSAIPGIAGGIACLGLVFAGLFGLAGIRLQRRLDAFQAERRTPRNRDALVAVITEFERVALDLLLEYRILAELKEKYPGQDLEVTPQKIDAYHAAKEKLELEERIAGADFAWRLSLYRTSAGLNVERWRYTDEPITEEAYGGSRDQIRQRTANILRQLDDGQLYRPTSRPAVGKASPPSR